MAKARAKRASRPRSPPREPSACAIDAIDCLCRHLRLDHPTAIPIEDIAWECGALVSDGAPTGARATLARVGDDAILAVAAGLSVGERRFAIAHEILHLLLHAAWSSFGLCTGADMATTDADRFRLEVEANDGATHLLMPKDRAGRYCDTSHPWEGIRAMADDLRVSLPAAARRFIELGPRDAALIYQVKGKVEWVHPSPRFPGFIPRKRSVRSEAAASVGFASGASPRAPVVVPARAWIPNADEKATLLEHAYVSPEFGSVMSIVWTAT